MSRRGDGPPPPRESVWRTPPNAEHEGLKRLTEAMTRPDNVHGGETHGDASCIACPWCGATLWLADDNRLAGGADECEHCEKPFTLEVDWSCDTTARRAP